MKKYQNVTHSLLCVEFEDFAQFLKYGQSIETKSKVKNVPEGIQVTDIAPPKKRTSRKSKQD